MNRSLIEIEKELDLLSFDEQQLLIQRFLDRHSKLESSLKAFWASEADKRLDELLTGKVEGIDADEVFDEMQRIIDEKD